MFEILYGIPHSIVEAIKCLYTNTTALVITPDGETTYFDIVTGIVQGDTLAPFLSIVLLDYVPYFSLDNMKEKGLQTQPKRSRTHLAQHLRDLDSADHLVLLTEAVSDAESHLQSLENAATLVGHHSYVGKIEHITNSVDPPEL